MIRLRPAGPEDVPLMFDIRADVSENQMTADELARINITFETITALLETEARGWVAQDTGFAIALPEGEIFALFVREAAQGQGIGRALLTACEDWLFARHEVITLETGADPAIRAHGFYRAMGWRAAGHSLHGLRYEKRRFRTVPNT